MSTTKSDVNANISNPTKNKKGRRKSAPRNFRGWLKEMPWVERGFFILVLIAVVYAMKT